MFLAFFSGVAVLILLQVMRIAADWQSLREMLIWAGYTLNVCPADQRDWPGCMDWSPQVALALGSRVFANPCTRGTGSATHDVRSGVESCGLLPARSSTMLAALHLKAEGVDVKKVVCMQMRRQPF
jgi:hypothetical protein